MKSSRRPRSSSTTTTVAYRNDHSAPGSGSKITEIPIQSVPEEQSPSKSVPITVHLPGQSQSREQSYAAVKIQSAYRSHMVRTLETVDAVRTNERERIKINEALMSLLLKLDSVPGLDPNVRELRRHVSRRIVGLQEILDAVSDTRVSHWDGYLSDWDDIVVGIEKEVCRERGGGHEMERFCAEHLGFQCLQRFLRE
ncbi:hypothetical protein BUALT_Bualt03G0084300 [Buddleja alternifolia]|uniref:BAG domain-containing protein n=1 Tax=Buddleja alternifolia TaxID=168488 RepID=A0AAV6XU92_9LAMI|nr:hypothetical protein BUALT_Bualt03G0084300 [Buddleja alternifolia]